MAIIKEGRIITVESMENLKATKKRVFEVTFKNEEDAINFIGTMKDSKRKENKVIVNLSGEIDGFIKAVSKYDILDFNIRTQSLEELFMHYYGGGK